MEVKPQKNGYKIASYIFLFLSIPGLLMAVSSTNFIGNNQDLGLVGLIPLSIVFIGYIIFFISLVISSALYIIYKNAQSPADKPSLLTNTGRQIFITNFVMIILIIWLLFLIYTIFTTAKLESIINVPVALSFTAFNIIFGFLVREKIKYNDNLSSNTFLFFLIILLINIFFSFKQ